jgi:phosphoribosylformylglycinamidine cyclo-ligase
MLPDGLGARLDRGSWPVPPIFDLIAEASGSSRDELFSTLNLGLGMALVVGPDAVDAVVRRAKEAGTQAFPIGRVAPGSGVEIA